MPRIDAPTVREHRENVRRKLIDAAEEIVRRDGVEALSAGAVSKSAGIARNSIYRYVDSVDDLRGMVLARYLPQWMGAVEAALAEADTPRERIVVWAQANLAQAARHGHGWLMTVGRAPAVGAARHRAVEGAHRDSADVLLQQWYEHLGVSRDSRSEAGVGLPEVCAELTRGLVESGFRCLDAGGGFAAVTEAVELAVAALLDAHRLPTTSESG